MTHLIIVFRGIADCKELTAETFAVSEKEWLKLKNMEYRKVAMQLPNYSRSINVWEIFNACDIATKSETSVDYLTSNKVMTFLREFVNNQRSQFDEVYY